MKRLYLLTFIVLSACNSTWIGLGDEKTLCDLADGERGCGLSWAFTGEFVPSANCLVVAALLETA